MPRHKPFADRFWDKVRKSDNCWIWSGKTSEYGYGFVYCSGHYRMAHRVAYELSTGLMLDPSIDALHRCDNPSCVNPDHIFLGTQFDNMRDMASKGRSFSQKNREIVAARLAKVRIRPPIGASNWLAKLTDEKVSMIRRLRREGRKYDEIAAIVGIGKSTVGRVVNRDARGGWSHVSD